MKFHILGYILYFLFFSSSACASSKIVLSPDKGLERIYILKKEQLDLTYPYLSKAAQSYTKDGDSKKLRAVFKYYPKIFKAMDHHFVVEMFSSIYQKDSKKLLTILKEATDKETVKEFKKRIQLVIKEETQGNG